MMPATCFRHVNATIRPVLIRDPQQLAADFRNLQSKVVIGSPTVPFAVWDLPSASCMTYAPPRLARREHSPSFQAYGLLQPPDGSHPRSRIHSTFHRAVVNQPTR